ncbi:MAG: hypothetical protein J6V09_05410 [Clostridia bacterium]|nr:hypothetical protein [Clostridia bacterium]
MKKIISCLLVLMLLISSVAVLSACGEKGPTPLDKAKEIVFTMYKDTVNTAKDYEVVSQVMVGSEVFTITWEATNAANVKINAPEGNKVKIEITQSNEADVNYTLTATIKDAKGNTKTVSFDRVIPQEKMGNEKPVAGTAYKFYLNQAILGKILFFNGKMSGEYLGTTEDPSVSPDVFSEEAEGGYRLYFMDGTTKTYIQIYKNSNDKIRPQLTTEPSMVFTYDDTIKVFFATIDETQYYLGTYDTWTTFSASKASYITGSNASKIDSEQFPAKFAKTSSINIVEKTPAQKVEKEKADLSISGNETATDNYSITLHGTGASYSDVTITWEVVGETAAAAIEGDKLNITLQKAATSVTVKATITCGEESDTKEFEISVPKIPTIVPAVVDNPVVGTAYKLYIKQANLGKNLYFTGAMNSYYYGTTENYSTAPDVYLEAATGGYYLTFTLGGTKQYLAIESETKESNGEMKTYINVVFKTDVAEASVFAFNTEYKTFTTTIGEDTYYIGTYGTYNTFSASKISKISTSFPGQLVTMVDLESIPADDKIATEKADLKAPATVISEATSIDLATAGTTYSDVAISWAVSGSDLASIVDGKLVVSGVPASNTTITLTATLAVGTTTDTATFEITLKALSQADIVNMAYALAKDTALTEKYSLTGYILAIDSAYNSQYKNISIVIVVENLIDKPILCYRMTAVNKDDAAQLAQLQALKAGDIVTVNGILKNYNGTIEFDANCTLEAVDTTTGLTDAQKLEVEKYASKLDKDIVSLPGNVALPTTGANTDITISWAVNTNDYATVDGGNLVVSSIPSEIVELTLTATYTLNEATVTKEFKIKLKALTQAEIVDLAYELAKGETISGMTLTGAIIRIDTKYDSGYKNITVTIVVANADKPIECFRLTVADKNNADELAKLSALKVGDVITVTGDLTNYNGKIEFNTGALLANVDASATLTDAQKAAIAREAISAPATSITEAGTTALVGESNGATITWTVSENEYATITADGLVVSNIPTVNTTVTLTATIVVGEASITKTFYVTINAPKPQGTEVTLVSSNLGYTNAQDFASKTIQEVTISAEKNSGNNGPKYYTSGSALRFYSKNSLTISVASGYKIESIVITTGSSNKIPSATCTVTNGTATGLDTTTVTVIPADGTASVVLTNTATSGHWRVEKIVVIYSAVE